VVANALFVGIGQSNEAGVCVAADVNNFSGFATPQPAIRYFRYLGKSGNPPSSVVRDPVSGVGDLQPRVIGAGSPFNPGTNGPEISMLKTIHADSRFANRVCGLSFALDASDTGRWIPSATFPTGSVAYPGTPANWFSTLVTNIKEAQTLTNSSIRLGGLFVENGTSDALSGGLAAAYYPNMDAIVNGLWNAFSCHFPVVIGRISQDFINNFAGAATDGPTVRAAQVQWAGDNGMPWIDNDALVTMSASPYDPHYNSNSQATLGVNRAVAWLSRKQQRRRR